MLRIINSDIQLANQKCKKCTVPQHDKGDVALRLKTGDRAHNLIDYFQNEFSRMSIEHPKFINYKLS
ncbi:MAG: hypothetical protein DSM106950_33505 [Stigonema ocellatum SAG 48.90 = DSM 106950]|nr:hypothetical protein [Stigonema ocellatum SAG 48.90 = DSM 106950]